MKEIITYSLSKDDYNSDEYYKVVSIFTDEVIKEIQEFAHLEIEDFKEFISENKIEKLRSDTEYYLEFILLGILWKVYINKSICISKIPKTTLIKLSKLREEEFIKTEVDYLRGILETIFLSKEEGKSVEFSLDNLVKLLEWLLATGEFKEEVIRLNIWASYLWDKSENEINKIIYKAVKLGEWFEKNSEEKLGCYTKNVEKFHREVYKNYKWREDFIYCGRKRVEYHLNMVGAEILNRAYKADFMNTKEKRLLLPACMRINSNKKCQAVKTSEGYMCSSCNSLCNINKYKKIVQKYNLKVYIIPHESSISKREQNNKDKIGIIGVSCVLNLISGGWKAKALGFIPQCVLLDYCGCKNHWHKEGIITDINTRRLLDIIGEYKIDNHRIKSNHEN